MSTPWLSLSPRVISGSLTSERAGCGEALRGRVKAQWETLRSGRGRAWAGAGRLARVSEEKELGKCLGSRGTEVSARRPRGSWRPGRGAPADRKRVPRPGWGSLPRAKPPRSPSPERQLPAPYSPRSFGSVCLRSRSFAQVPPPQPGPATRCAPASPLPRAPRPHLGAGAGPAHRPEQQQRQAERPGGAGHGGALRTEPSLPPAEPRATTDPGQAASGGRGGGAGAGPPRPREGPGGVPGLQPRPAKASRPPRCAAQPVPAGCRPALRPPPPHFLPGAAS